MSLYLLTFIQRCATILLYKCLFFIEGMVVMDVNDSRQAVLNVRVSGNTKRILRELAKKYMAELGTKVSQSQAVEMAIAEAARKRSVS